MSWRAILAMAALGGVFVVVPLGLYVALAPSFDQYVGACGTLPSPADQHRVLLPLSGSGAETTVVEVIDPLCPACRTLEQRFEASELAAGVNRKMLLFPLDNECNWMVDRAIHPGACAASEALLCAGGDAEDVLGWIFDEQDQLLEASRADPTAAEQMITARFPGLSECIGSAEVRARLNRALRWAVQNQLPVQAPQLYVEGLKLCDEDTDLGLEYMLPRLIDRARSGQRASGPGSGQEALASRRASEEGRP